jgi:hypothetical protein
LKKSRTGRLGGKRACLCKDGTYSRKCCDGGLWAQGIGNITGEQVENGVNTYKVQHCENSREHNIHLHEGTLVIGAVYYIRFQNPNHDGCHTVVSAGNGQGLHINSVTLYSDCTDCQTQNP